MFVSGDERYEFWVDGERVGRGPHRADPTAWPYDAYELDLGPGEHVLMARVWWGAESAAFASLGSGCGWLLAADRAEDAERFNTGVAKWEAAVLAGLRWLSPLCAWGTGDNVEISGQEWPWSWETGATVAGLAYAPAEIDEDVAGGETGQNLRVVRPRLAPAVLPPMCEHPWRQARAVAVQAVAGPETGSFAWAAGGTDRELAAWTALARGEGHGVTVPARTRLRVLYDLVDYVAAWPVVRWSAGAGSRMRLHWAESLFETPDGGGSGRKGRRNEWVGKYFTATWEGESGVGDAWIADGGIGRRGDTPWWQCGRWAEFYVETADQPLVVEALELTETRYPMEDGPVPETNDPRWGQAWRICRRSLQLCMHETYVDCPYYEQLMYAGDTRVQMLATYMLTTDARLPAHALELFARSLGAEGLTASRHPSRRRQTIAPFSLIWVGMLRDYAWWRDDAERVRRLLPTARRILTAFAERVDETGLFTAMPGWNFVDWVPTWDTGEPPSHNGLSAVLAGQWLLALREAMELEEAFGWPEQVAVWRRYFETGVAAVNALFWDEARGLYADDQPGGSFSEHAQCVLLLAGAVPEARRERVARGLREDTGLARTTIYFTHYLFEAYRLIGYGAGLANRMGFWFGLAEGGFCTTPEQPEPSRSDCHGWGAHPIFHLVATVGGLRPTAPGFAAWEMRPLPGVLKRLEVETIVAGQVRRLVVDGDSARLMDPAR